MFREGLKTLKRRTTELLEHKLSEGLDAIRAEVSALDEIDGPPSPSRPPDVRESRLRAQQLSNLTRRDALMVHYQVQNGECGDREDSGFVLPVGCDGNATLADVRANFPLAGSFHFRFRTSAPNGAFGGYIWIDLANDQDDVPVAFGEVWLKALRMPTGCQSRDFEAPPGEWVVAMDLPITVGLSSRQARTSGRDYMDEQSGSRERSQSPPMPVEQSRAQQPPPPPPPPQKQEPASPAPPPAPPSDLMDLGSGGSGSAPASTRTPATSSAAPPDPVIMPNRQELVEKRLAEQQARIDAKQAAVIQRRQTEESLRSGKLEASNALYAELDAWSHSSDGKSLKDIRTMLSTMHTVLWPDSGWKPVSLAELVANENNIKRLYRKAILMCHPDRHQEAEPDVQYRAERVFQALNEAFREANNQ